MKVIGRGWFHLGTPLDDDSRSIMAWRLGTRMKTREVGEAPDLALQASACDRATVLHKPRELGDDGAGHISGAMADWLDDQHMDHGRGAPCHPGPMSPRTQGRIERWPQTLKNRIVLEDDGLPGALKHRIEALVDHCNHQRHHEGLQILTLADVCFGRGNTILRRREGIKRKTIEARRLLHRNTAA